MMRFHYQPDLSPNLTFSSDTNKTDYGSADISPIYGAFAIATKGHFFEINPAIKTPKIYNLNGDVINSTFKQDDTYVGVEKFSGINLRSKFRT